jgi:hypothetical protein
MGGGSSLAPPKPYQSESFQSHVIYQAEAWWPGLTNIRVLAYEEA